MRFRQRTLQELIEWLASRPDHEAFVHFDFGDLCPGLVDSYRGYYQDLAISYCDTPCTVARLLENLSAVKGVTLQGYKGGDFLMTGQTKLWASNYGRASGTMIIGFGGEYSNIIRTWHDPYPDLDTEQNQNLEVI